MGKNLKISIITPSFNQGEYLEETIRSVFFQDYSNIEYIIIDGGSKDKSLNIIRKYENRIAYWQSRPDKGQANAINIGFKKATGEILAWINADDVYMPGAVKRIVDEFTSYPDLDLIYGDCVFIDKNGNFLRYFTECEEYNPNRLLNFSNFIMQPTTFFSKNKFFDVGMLDETLCYTMDWDLWCRLAIANSKIKYISSVLAANRVYSSTKTSSGGNKRLLELWRIQKRYSTGVWPQALWGFLATEIYQKGEKSNNQIKRVIFNLLGKSISFLSPKAKVYSWLNKVKKKTKYGFYPHSYMCNGKAYIHLPVFKKKCLKAIEIKVGLNKRTNKNEKKLSVNIFIENILLKNIILTNKHKKKREIIDTDFLRIMNRSIMLLIEFKNEKGELVSGDIYSVKVLF